MNRMRAAALALLVIAASLASAQARKVGIAAKKAPTHEMLWLMKRVSSPLPSPDGKWVVFSVTEPAYDEKDQSSDLWLVPADGSAAPRQITHTKSSESDVTWSPDSRTIAFSAKREGDDSAQIYLLDVNGGEARRVTTLSTGARAPQFRPDGAALLVTATVYPGAADDDANKKAAKERKDQKYKVRVYETFPIRQWDRWLDDTQTHLVVVPLGTPGPSHDILAGTKLASSPGFGGRSGEGSREEIDAAWTPDGGSIVIAATATKNVGAYAEFAHDLYVTDGNGE